MHSGLESFLVKVQTIRDSFTPYRRTNTKDLFQPYSPVPEKIKALTDKTKALYEDLLRMKRNIVMERIKVREGKLLALVEHELKHYFGKPYENNYYTGMTQVSFIHSLIHLSIHPSVRPSVHLFLRPSALPSASHSLLPPICPSIHLIIGMFVCPSFPLSVCPFPRLFDPFAYPLYVRSFVRSLLRFSVHPFSHMSVPVLLFGRAAWDICFNQSEVLPRTEVIRNRYGITALVSQRSFCGETSRGVAKCRMFSQACSFLLPSQFFLSIIQKRRSMDARP